MVQRLRSKFWKGTGGRVAAGTLVLALAAGLAGCGEPDTAKLLEQARASIAKKDTEAARIQLKSALQQTPNSAEARFLLGELLLNGGDVAGAEVELRRALELQHPDVQVLPALAQRDQRREREAGCEGGVGPPHRQREQAGQARQWAAQRGNGDDGRQSAHAWILWVDVGTADGKRHGGCPPWRASHSPAGTGPDPRWREFRSIQVKHGDFGRCILRRTMAS